MILPPRKKLTIAGYIAYVWQVFRNPHLYDFLDKGRGIEARYAAFSAPWQEHFERCHQFQKRVLQEKAATKIAVVGAGNLYDLAPEFLQPPYALYCYDADPLAAQHVQKSWPHINYTVDEITGCIFEWNDRLKNCIKQKASYEELCALLSSFCGDRAPYLLTPCDTVVSLNILGQIPLYWAQQLESRLEQLAPQPSTTTEPLIKAAKDTFAHLQKLHLQSLQAQSPERILIITDTTFMFDPHSPQKSSEEALYINPHEVLQGYTLCDSEKWIWQVVPEQEHHEITAWYFKKIVGFNKNYLTP